MTGGTATAAAGAGRPAARRAAPAVGQLLSTAEMGGSEVYAALLANAHAAAGGRSEVLVLGEPGPVSRRFDERVGVHHLGYRRASLRRPFAFAVSVLAGYRLLSRAVRRHGIAVLQTHLPDTNLWGLALCLTGRCRVVVTIHNNAFLPTSGGTAFGDRTRLVAYRLILRRCAAVVCVSESVRRSLLDTLRVPESAAGRVTVVTNGVPIPPPPTEAQRRQVRARHGVGEDQVWIVMAGRLTEAKNPACLLEALALLPDLRPRLRVLIAGEGHLRPELEALVERHGLAPVVSLPGNRDDLGQIMAAADLLAMPSRWEGVPMVLLEALARGLPVVGTRIPGLADVVEDGRHGILVEIDSPGPLALALRALVEDAARRRRMAEACLALARERYDFDRVYGALRRIYLAASGG